LTAGISLSNSVVIDRTGEAFNATDMPISGPLHAINLQSINANHFEGIEKIFAILEIQGLAT
jgi:hypothetical protein